MRPAPYLLVFDGFADWEAAYATAELRRSGRHPVLTVSFTGEPVVSMGGLCVLPDFDLSELDPAVIEILILPGGDRWETAPPDATLAALITALLNARTPVAAICGATVALARDGLLVGRQHTSNSLEYLKHHAPGYGGELQYVDALAVRDRNLITASGLGALEFAREIFAEIGVFSDADREAWYRIFKEGKV